jgi:hypothetical protein
VYLKPVNEKNKIFDAIKNIAKDTKKGIFLDVKGYIFITWLKNSKLSNKIKNSEINIISVELFILLKGRVIFFI